MIQPLCPTPHPELAVYSPAGEKPDAALKGTRPVFWDGGFQETPVYEHRLLQCGNVVVGPAIVEGEDTTILIPQGKRYSVDKFLFGIIEER